jgi:hypothetical protein
MIIQKLKSFITYSLILNHILTFSISAASLAVERLVSPSAVRTPYDSFMEDVRERREASPVKVIDTTVRKGGENGAYQLNFDNALFSDLLVLRLLDNDNNKMVGHLVAGKGRVTFTGLEGHAFDVLSSMQVTSLSVNVAGRLSFLSTLKVEETTSIISRYLTVEDFLEFGGNTEINVTEDILQKGSMEGNAKLLLNFGRLLSHKAIKAESIGAKGRELTVEETGSLASVKDGMLEVRRLENSGSITAGISQSIHTTEDMSNGGRLEAPKVCLEHTGRASNESGGVIRASTLLTTKFADFHNSGKIDAIGDLIGLGTDFYNYGGASVYAGNLMQMTAKHYNMLGGLTEWGQLGLINADAVKMVGSVIRCSRGIISALQDITMDGDSHINAAHYLGLNSKATLAYYANTVLSDGVKVLHTPAAGTQNISDLIAGMPTEIAMNANGTFWHRGEVRSGGSVVYSAGDKFVYSGTTRSGFLDTYSIKISALNAEITGKLKATGDLIVAVKEELFIQSLINETLIEARNIQLQAEKIKIEAELKAAEALAIAAKRDIELASKSKVGAKNAVVKSEEGGVILGGDFTTSGDATVSGKKFVDMSGTTKVGGGLTTITDGHLSHTGCTKARDMLIHARTMTNMGHLTAEESARIKADYYFLNGFGGSINARNINVDTAVMLNLLGGIHGSNSVTVNALVDFNLGAIASMHYTSNALIGVNAGLVMPSFSGEDFFTWDNAWAGVKSGGLAIAPGWFRSGVNWMDKVNGMRSKAGGIKKKWKSLDSNTRFADYIALAMDVKSAAVSGYSLGRDAVKAGKDAKRVWSDRKPKDKGVISSPGAAPNPDVKAEKSSQPAVLPSVDRSVAETAKDNGGTWEAVRAAEGMAKTAGTAAVNTGIGMIGSATTDSLVGVQTQTAFTASMNTQRRGLFENNAGRDVAYNYTDDVAHSTHNGTLLAGAVRFNNTSTRLGESSHIDASTVDIQASAAATLGGHIRAHTVGVKADAIATGASSSTEATEGPKLQARTIDHRGALKGDGAIAEAIDSLVTREGSSIEGKGAKGTGRNITHDGAMTGDGVSLVAAEAMKTGKDSLVSGANALVAGGNVTHGGTLEGTGNVALRGYNVDNNGRVSSTDGVAQIVATKRAHNRGAVEGATGASVHGQDAISDGNIKSSEGAAELIGQNLAHNSGTGKMDGKTAAILGRVAIQEGVAASEGLTHVHGSDKTLVAASSTTTANRRVLIGKAKSTSHDVVDVPQEVQGQSGQESAASSESASALAQEGGSETKPKLPNAAERAAVRAAAEEAARHSTETTLEEGAKVKGAIVEIGGARASTAADIEVEKLSFYAQNGTIAKPAAMKAAEGDFHLGDGLESAKAAIDLANGLTGVHKAHIDAAQHDLRTTEALRLTGAGRERSFDFNSVDIRAAVSSEGAVRMDGRVGANVGADVTARTGVAVTSSNGAVNIRGARVATAAGTAHVAGATGVRVESTLEGGRVRRAGVTTDNGNVLLQSGGDLNTVAAEIRATGGIVQGQVAGNQNDRALDIRSTGAAHGRGFLQSHYVGDHLNLEIGGRLTSQAGKYEGKKGGRIAAKKGIEALTLADTRVVERWRRRHGWFGEKLDEGFREGTEFTRPEFTSQEGGMDLLAAEARVDVEDAAFRTAGKSRIYGRDGVHLGAAKASNQYRDAKYSLFGLNKDKRTGTQEVAQTSEITGKDKVIIASAKGDITGDAPTITLEQGGALYTPEGTSRFSPLELRSHQETQSRQLTLSTVIDSSPAELHPVAGRIASAAKGADGATGVVSDIAAAGGAAFNSTANLARGLNNRSLADAALAETGATRLNLGFHQSRSTTDSTDTQHGSIISRGPLEVTTAADQMADFTGMKHDIERLRLDGAGLRIAGSKKTSQHRASSQSYMLSFDAANPTSLTGSYNERQSRSHADTVHSGRGRIGHLEVVRDGTKLDVHNAQAAIGSLSGAPLQKTVTGDQDVENVRDQSLGGSLSVDLTTGMPTAASASFSKGDLTHYTTPKLSSLTIGQGAGVQVLTAERKEDQTKGRAISVATNISFAPDGTAFSNPVSVGYQNGNQHYRVEPTFVDPTAVAAGAREIRQAANTIGARIAAPQTSHAGDSSKGQSAPAANDNRTPMEDGGEGPTKVPTIGDLPPEEERPAAAGAGEDKPVHSGAGEPEDDRRLLGMTLDGRDFSPAALMDLTLTANDQMGKPGGSIDNLLSPMYAAGQSIIGGIESVGEAISNIPSEKLAQVVGAVVVVGALTALCPPAGGAAAIEGGGIAALLSTASITPQAALAIAAVGGMVSTEGFLAESMGSFKKASKGKEDDARTTGPRNANKNIKKEARDREPDAGKVKPMPKGIFERFGWTRAKPKTSVQKGGQLRPRAIEKDSGRIHEWDSRHGEIETYDRSGRHLGVTDPKTGKLDIMKADPARNIKL